MTIWAAASRNLKMHWRDRTGVFFSFLAPLIILMLFLGFLGNSQVDSLVDRVPGLARETAWWSVQSWLVGAICFTTTVTMPMGAIGVLVDDRIHSRLDDLLAAPVSRRVLAAGYTASALVTALIGTLGVWILGVGTMAVQGNPLPGPVAFAKTGLALIVSCAVFSGFATLLATAIRSQNAYAAFSTILGTMVGFVAGVYVPMGVLPAGVANTVTALPFAQAATLVRQPWAADSFAAMTQGAPVEVANSVSQDLGLTASIGGHGLPTWILWLSLLAYGLAFAAVAARGLGRVVRRG